MKYKLCFSAALILLQLSLLAQQNQPVIRSNTKDIVVKYNENLHINWLLQPEIKPDVFYVGSSLRAQKLRFVTDVDSIEYDVQPGGQYDFIVMLNGEQACYTRIAALENPYLLQKGVGLFTLAGIVLLLTVTFIRRKHLPIPALLWLGIITPTVFWVITVAAGFIHGNYNHIKNAVSVLGEIGSASAVFMAIGTLLLALLSLYFSIGFYAASKKLRISVIPAIMSTAMAVSFAWAAVFPSGHYQHGTLGPLPLLVMLGALLAVVLWPKGKDFKKIRLLSLLGFLVMLLFVVRFVPAIQRNAEGLVQRFLYMGWSVWFVSVGIELKRLLHTKKSNV
jgi:hypothetical membrane protein